MISFLRKLPIKTQLYVIAVCIILSMVFIMFSSYTKITGIITNNSREYSAQLFTQIKKSVDANCDNIDRIVTSIAYNPVVQDYMNEESESKKFEYYQKLDEFMLKSKNLREGILDIYIIGNKMDFYSLSRGGDRISKIAPEPIPERIKAYYSELKKFDDNGINSDCFVVGTSIYSIDSQKVHLGKIGVLEIFIDRRSIISDVGVLSKMSDTRFYLLDRVNRVFMSNDEGMIGKNFNMINDIEGVVKSGQEKLKINGKWNLVHIEKMPQLGGYIISIVPEKEVLSSLAEVKRWVLIIFVLAIAIICVPFTSVTNNILQPIKKFLLFFSEIKDGNLKNLKKRITLEGYPEISNVGNEFNSMLDEIDGLTHRLIDTNTRLYETELLKKQSELGFLKSQINPHFLYNTLESIKSIANINKIYQISDMSKALAQIFRYSIKGEDVVTLAEELEITKSYITIQQIRFSDRFDTEYDFTEEVLRCKVVKMILQPLVENAVYHGLETKMGQGHLLIKGQIEDNNLIISIIDDGKGISKDTLSKICSKLSETGELIRKYDREDSISIGLVNVNNRIRLTYGELYGVNIKSVPDKGTSVIIKIPAGGKANV